MHPYLTFEDKVKVVGILSTTRAPPLLQILQGGYWRDVV